MKIKSITLTPSQITAVVAMVFTVGTAIVSQLQSGGHAVPSWITTFLAALGVLAGLSHSPLVKQPAAGVTS